MSQQRQETDHFSWDSEPWENLCNGTFNNSRGDHMSVPLPETGDVKRVREAMRKEKGKGEKAGKKKGEEMFDHEIHIWTERERRKKMRNMFSNLHSLLPHLPPKADKSTIVDEAIGYIKALESTFQNLQKKKQEKFKGEGPSTIRFTDVQPSVSATSRLALLSTRESFMADQVSSMTNNINNSVTSGTSTNFLASDSQLPVIIQTWSSTNVVLNICGNDAQIVVYVPKRQGLLTTICCVLEKHKLEVVTAQIFSEADRCGYMFQARVANGICEQFPQIMNVEEIYKQTTTEIMMCLSP